LTVATTRPLGLGAARDATTWCIVVRAQSGIFGLG
jgi:hypothetical protein